MNRTQNALKNISWGWISKILSLILGFISRTVFICYLGKTYLGVNGLYTEILNMLSLAELGFGTAFSFAMYKPVAEKDTEKITKLLSFFKRTYNVVAFVVAILGIAFLPFLQYIVKGADDITIGELRLFFVFFLLNTVINYFVTYKYSYINALQKNYITTNIDSILNIAIISIQTIIIIITRNFLAYLLAHLVLVLISRIAISLYLNHKFPILKVKSRVSLSKEEKKPIFTEVKGLFIHQFSSVAVHSTDNIIISSLSGLGVVAVGLVSNYNLIINSILAFVVIIFSNFTASFGNIVATSTSENYHTAFKDMNFINFWIYGFCSIAFFVLIPPFITLWLGVDYLIDNVSFLLIVLNCYLLGQSTIYNNARIAKGNFNKDKWISFAQAIVNLVVSVIGAVYLGLVGVYIGTVVSRLVTIVFKPLKTYKMLFDVKCTRYYKSFVIYFLATIISGAVTYFVSQTILREINIITFIISVIVVALIPNAIFLLFFCKTKEFANVKKRILNILRRKSKNDK